MTERDFGIRSEKQRPKVRELLSLVDEIRDLGPYSEGYLLKERLREMLSSQSPLSELDDIEERIRWHSVFS